MAPTKLTEAEKETIFRLYRETDETTSTLSRQYGVSVSTISRLLKSKLPLEEYEDLVRSKRSGLNRSNEDSFLDALADSEEALGDEEDGSILDQVDSEEEEGMNDLETASSQSSPQSLPAFSDDRSFSSDCPGDRRRRRRSSIAQDVSQDVDPDPPQGRETEERSSAPQGLAQVAPGVDSQQLDSQQLDSQQLDLLTSLADSPREDEPASFRRPILRKPPEPEVSPDPSLEDEEDEDYVYSFGDEEFGDDDDDFEEDDDSEEESLGLAPLFGQEIEILSLSEAHLPRVCYLVVDRTGELVTCRLQDFRELGQIPDAEAHHRTLPLFDNHRIARRFSRRNQRVIKLPDGKMLQKTARSLGTKGITRLLLDGKVYDLES